jgi:Gram-negative bacterial TonB protein C-terminal
VYLAFRSFSVLSALCISGLLWAQADDSRTASQGVDSSKAASLEALPQGVILAKGARPSATDSMTPLPEGGSIVNGAYVNSYFGLSYPLPSDWPRESTGPPPSDSGYYVLAQHGFPAETGGYLLVDAQDLFFTSAASALEMVSYDSSHLAEYYKLERPASEVKIAGRAFLRYDYEAPAAGLHWRILATEIRCHVIEFVFMSRDAARMEDLIRQMNKMTLPAEASPTAEQGGGDTPVCIKDYANGDNMIEKTNPVLTGRVNPIPVRIIVDKEGKIKHVHFISAFPEQAKAITDALAKWRFKPYLRDGQPVEVETGIMFRQAARPARPPTSNAIFPDRGSFVSVHICDYEQVNNAMSREQKVAAYLCIGDTNVFHQDILACSILRHATSSSRFRVTGVKRQPQREPVRERVLALELRDAFACMRRAGLFRTAPVSRFSRYCVRFCGCPPAPFSTVSCTGEFAS